MDELITPMWVKSHFSQKCVTPSTGAALQALHKDTRCRMFLPRNNSEAKRGWVLEGSPCCSSHCTACDYSSRRTGVCTLHKQPSENSDSQTVHQWAVTLRESTQLTFIDSWTPLCSNCSSTHTWSTSGGNHSLCSSFAFCQGPNDYSLSWWLVLRNTLLGSLP